MTKAQVVRLQKAILEAVHPLVEAESLRIELHGGTVTSPESVIRFKILDPTVEPKESRDFKRLRRVYGLREGLLNSKVRFFGEEYIVRGLNPRASKRKMVLERVRDGRIMRAPVRPFAGAPSASLV